jgi:hypothetical protein
MERLLGESTGIGDEPVSGAVGAIDRVAVLFSIVARHP